MKINLTYSNSSCNDFSHVVVDVSFSSRSSVTLNGQLVFSSCNLSSILNVIINYLVSGYKLSSQDDISLFSSFVNLIL